MLGNLADSSASDKWIKDPIVLFGKKFDKPFRESSGESGTVIPISGFGCQMQYIRWICFIAAHPVLNVFPETAADLRVEPNDIVTTEML